MSLKDEAIAQRQGIQIERKRILKLIAVQKQETQSYAAWSRLVELEQKIEEGN